MRTNRPLRFLASAAVGTAFVVGIAAPAQAQAQAQAQQTPSDSVVRAIIQERVDAGRFAGIAVGIVPRGGARRVITYGPNAGVRPFDGNSVFEIGSITKTFTASILADMVKKGEVKLDDPVEQYLPAGTKIPSRDGRKITLLDLAVQNSGLPRMPDNFKPKDPDNPYADYTTQQLYDFLASYTLPRGVGEKYEYSNLAVGLLGQALSNRAGTSYETLVTERVLTPLGMIDTRITLSPAMQSRLAPGHADSGKPAKNWDLPTFAGAGALRSTVNDMLTYIAANADSSSMPLGPTMAMTHAERSAGLAANITIGLIWNRLRGPSGNVMVWHNGGTGGYRTFTGYNERTGLGVVVLSNTSQSVDDIGLHLLDATFPLQPLPKPHAAIMLDEAALDKFIGMYDLAPNFTITIARTGAQLSAQATGQGAFPIFPEGKSEFFAKVTELTMTFTYDESGVVSGMVVHQGGANNAGKKR
jgi:D-alanyl-D-alanine-carboxypeptidase/D-alanyl-D-alanine-endopeptidase